MHTMRTIVGQLCISIGMKILPADVRKMARDIIMYHVPGALSEDEKSDVRAAKSEWMRKEQAR